MKLYDFEKYYIALAINKIFIFLNKVWSHKILIYLIIAIISIVWMGIVLIGFIYFFIGVNSFLEIIHLEQFRIESFHFLSSSQIDLKPFFKK